MKYCYLNKCNRFKCARSKSFDSMACVFEQESTGAIIIMKINDFVIPVGVYIILFVNIYKCVLQPFLTLRYRVEIALYSK